MMVVATKLEPALVLAAALNDDELLLHFGSVSGVFGNGGQVDYAAANAVLDALAANRSASGAAGMAIDWGPWAGGGMVTVKANGGGELVEIRIDPKAIDPDDPEMLADIVLAAANEALRSAADLVESKIKGQMPDLGAFGL